MNRSLSDIIIEQYFEKIEYNEDKIINFLHINLTILNDQMGDHSSTRINNSYDNGIFLIHGLGGSTMVWLKQIPMLIKLGLDVVSIDLLGHGESSVSKNKNDYTFKELSETVLDLYDAFKRPSNILLAHSYGCCFAALIAHERRNSVKGLIMLGGGGPYPLDNSFYMPLCILSCFKCIMWKLFIKKSFYKNENHEFLMPPSMLALQYTMLGQYWIESDENYYASLTVPTMVMQGENDKLIDIEDTKQMHFVIANLLFIKQ